jgi:hypothetical protein
VPIHHLPPVAGFPIDASHNDLVFPQNRHRDVNKYPMWHLRSALSYMGLPQLSVLEVTEPLTQRVAGVRWRWTPTGWVAVTDSMPRARLVTDWRVSQDVRTDISAIDISRTVLVEATPGVTSGDPGTARIVSERRGEFVIETEAPGPQLLVLAERFHSGWEATIAGQPVPVQRGYGDYMVVRVPAGTHQVSLRFAPASARWGLMLTLVGLLAAVLGTVWLRRRRPQERSVPVIR